MQISNLFGNWIYFERINLLTLLLDFSDKKFNEEINQNALSLAGSIVIKSE